MVWGWEQHWKLHNKDKRRRQVRPFPEAHSTDRTCPCNAAMKATTPLQRTIDHLTLPQRQAGGGGGRLGSDRAIVAIDEGTRRRAGTCTSACACAYTGTGSCT